MTDYERPALVQQVRTASSGDVARVVFHADGERYEVIGKVASTGGKFGPGASEWYTPVVSHTDVGGRLLNITVHDTPYDCYAEVRVNDHPGHINHMSRFLISKFESVEVLSDEEAREVEERMYEERGLVECWLCDQLQYGEPHQFCKYCAHSSTDRPGAEIPAHYR
jgi:hypothetical protein